MSGRASSSLEGNFDLSSPETPSTMVWVSRGPYKPSASYVQVGDFKPTMSSTGGGKSKGGRGKPKSTKSVSRSSKIGLQFPVGVIARFLRPKSTPSMSAPAPSSTSLPSSNTYLPRY
ncbi:hypothetical protein RJ639_002735 [Escallonia herrerae]|uniref:Uncharacterized protein n=1 Tax=Escallonia herrerae TaxID=1293975 RepID=A0AA88W267_9ASTE|nr:hypothetical protein RJ639_002735 [Escallonia herrerae]